MTRSQPGADPGRPSSGALRRAERRRQDRRAGSTRRPAPARGRGAPRRAARRRRAERPSSWRWLLAPFTVLAVGTGLALLLAWHTDVNAQTPGEQAAAAAEGYLAPAPADALPEPHLLTSYEIVYRITEPDTPVQTEKRLTMRPFLGSDLTYGQHGLDSGVITNSSGGYIYVSSAKPHWGTLETGTYRATGDDLPAPALRLAVTHGQARILGSREILGRRCTVVRTGQPVGSPVTAPTASDYADMCIDPVTGQLLDEVWVFDKKFVRERRAVLFDTDPHLSASTFEVHSTGPVTPAGEDGSTDTVELGRSDLAKLPVFMSAPPGYHLDGVQDQVTDEEAPGDDQPTPDSEVVAHFVDGASLIDLEQGAIDPAPSGGIKVVLTGGRRAVLTLDLSASYLDVTLAGQDIRLEGTDIAALEAAAAGLKVQPSQS